MLSLLLVPAAGAGVWVEDLDAASLVLVLEDGEGEHLGLCADDGQGQDSEPGDGVWACGDVPVDGEVRMGLVIDGDSLVLSPRGTLPEGDITLHVSGDALTLTKGDPDDGDAGSPRAPVHAVFIEIDAGPMSQAPVVNLRGQREVQLPCRDNGEFPDRVQNDDIATCGGVAPGTELSVQIRSHSGQIDLAVSFDPSDSVLQARYSDGALEATTWPILPAELDLSAVSPQDVPEPGVEPDPVVVPEGDDPRHLDGPPPPGAQPGPQGGAPQGRPPGDDPRHLDGPPPPGAQPGPQGGAPQGRPPGGAPWWSLLLAALTLAGGVWLGRRMRSGLPGDLEWAHTPDGSTLERVDEDLDALVRTRSRHGPVIVVAAPGVVVPEGEPGPVLRATSHDVLDLAEALGDLRRSHRLRMLSLVIADEALLTSPGDVGLTAAERLKAHLPPGTRAFLL